MLADGFLTIASVKSLSASSKFPVREGNILIGVKKKEKQAKSAYKPAFYSWEERTLRTTTQVVQLETHATNSVVKCFLLAAKKACRQTFIHCCNSFHSLCGGFLPHFICNLRNQPILLVQ